MRAMDRSFRCLAALLIVAGCFVPALRAAEENELKDEAGKIIVRYMVEAPANVAPAGTTDPARQVGVIFCFQEHTSPPGADIFPGSRVAQAVGIERQLRASGRSCAKPAAEDSGSADYEPIQKLLAWAKKKYPVNPRRIYMYGKGSGGHVAGEFTMLYPNLFTAGITYSWGWWTMPSELDKPLDMVNSAPEFYLVLGMRDFTHHITTVRNTYERVKAKGYHIIYREFEELGDRSYHPTSNDDALRWATRLRNKNIPPSARRDESAQGVQRGQAAGAGLGILSDVGAGGRRSRGRSARKALPVERRRLSARPRPRRATTVFSVRRPPRRSASCLAILLRKCAMRLYRAIASYANWRSQAAQQVLIQRATDKSLDLDARLDAADALGQAVKLQAAGVQQDPPMFRALVALLSEENEPLRAVAFLALAPIREYIIGGSNAGQFPPAGGWEKWLDRITAEQAGDLIYYRVCGPAAAATPAMKPWICSAPGGPW